MTRAILAIVFLFSLNFAMDGQVTWKVAPNPVFAGQPFRMTVTNWNIFPVLFPHKPQWAIFDGQNRRVWPLMQSRLPSFLSPGTCVFTHSAYLAPGNYEVRSEYCLYKSPPPFPCSTLRSPLTVQARDLQASLSSVPVRTGGSVVFSLDAGTAHGGKWYWLAGCMDGTGPRGIPLHQVKLMLFPDAYFWFTVLYPNTMIQNSLGPLDFSGKGSATLRVPGGLPTSLIGQRFYHAYVVFKPGLTYEYASTAVPLTLSR